MLDILAAAMIDPGWNVPWSVERPRIVNEQLVQNKPERPKFKVNSLRIWDAGTTWGEIEQADDDFHWDVLDRTVANAEARGVSQITMVLWGTPDWASSNPDDKDAAPWLNKGSASAPRDVAEWLEFVGAVATRYAGHIDAYELANEPNLRWFWNGTEDQLLEMIDSGAREIKRVDPVAQVVAPAPVLTSEKIPASTSRLWVGLIARETPIDAFTFHYYPQSLKAAREGLVKTVAAVQRAVAGLPVWLTELDVKWYETSRDKAVAVKTMTSGGIDRAFWYAYMVE